MKKTVAVLLALLMLLSLTACGAKSMAPAEDMAVTKKAGKGNFTSLATAPKSIEMQIGFKKTLKEKFFCLFFSLGISEAVPKE